MLKPPTQTKKTDELIQLYHEELRHSVDYRRRYESTWRECYDLYAHRHKYSQVDKGSHRDKIMVNLAFSAINIQMAATSVQNPYVTVTERKPWHRTGAQTAEEAVNHAWVTNEFQDPVHDAWKDCLLIGHGWTKTAWQFEMTEFDRDASALDSEFTRVRGLFDMLAGTGPDDVADLPTDDEIRVALGERGYKVLQDHPVLDRVDPFDMFVDPQALRPRELRWICQRSRMPLKEAQKQEHWDKKARDGLTKMDTKQLGFVPTSDKDRRYDHSAIDWVDVWEYWDLKRGTVSIFSADAERFLVAPHPIPYRHGHPFVMVRDNEVPDSFYPIGELETVKDQQYEINRIRSTQLDTMRKEVRQWIMPESLAKQAGVRSALESQDPDVIIPIADNVWQDMTAGGAPPVIPMPQNTINGDFFAMSRAVADDFYEGIGLSDYFAGGAPESRTATEAAVANSGQQSRDAHKLDRLEKFISRIARKTLINMQSLMQTSDFVRLTGRQNSQLGIQGEFLQFDRKSIAGEFDFMVEAGSTQPQNPQLKKESALQLISAIQPLAAVLPGQINFQRLMQEILEQFGIKDPETFMIAQQPQLPGLGGPPGAPGGALPTAGTPAGGPPPIGAGGPPGAGQFPVPQEATPQLAGQLGLNL